MCIAPINVENIIFILKLLVISITHYFSSHFSVHSRSSSSGTGQRLTSYPLSYATNQYSAFNTCVCH